jgi:hypothetical protein
MSKLGEAFLYLIDKDPSIWVKLWFYSGFVGSGWLWVRKGDALSYCEGLGSCISEFIEIGLMSVVAIFFGQIIPVGFLLI